MRWPCILIPSQSGRKIHRARQPRPTVWAATNNPDLVFKSGGNKRNNAIAFHLSPFIFLVNLITPFLSQQTPFSPFTGGA